MLKKVNAIMLGLAVLLAFACGKENAEPENTLDLCPVAPKCRLVQDSIMAGNFNTYIYDAEGKVIRIDRMAYGQEYYELLEYNNACKIVRVNTYSMANELLFYKAYEYNDNNQLIRITDFKRAGPSYPIKGWGYELFTYSPDGKLSERNYFQEKAVSPYRSLRYTYQPDGVVVQKHFTDIGLNGALELEWIFEYRYDTKKNPYASLGYTVNTPLVSENNLVSAKKFDAAYNYNNETTWEHQYNADGYPISSLHSYGAKVQYYQTYNCQ